MISRLRVRNWKAYATLDVEFSNGATFIVAHNGVGKTSLMEALHYALFGETGLGVELSQARRIGTTDTYVEVEVQLDGGRVFRIERTITGALTRPVTSTRGILDGVDLGETEVTQAVATEFQADAAQLPMLLMVPDRALDRQINDASNVSIVGHLAQMLGVNRLRDTATSLTRLSQQENKTADTVRIADSNSSTLSQLTQEKEELTRRREELRERYNRLRTRLNTVREEQAAARAWADYSRAREDRMNSIMGQVEEFARLVDSSTDQTDFSDSSARDAILEQAREVERQASGRLATARSGIEQVERSIVLLGQAGPICPTCRRALSAEDAESARLELQAELRNLQVRAVEDAEQAENARRSLRALESIDRQIGTTPAPVQPSSAEPGTGAGELAASVSELEEQTEQTQRVGAETTSRIDAIDLELGRIAENEQREQEAVKRYRLAEIYKITAATMGGLADSLVSEHIEPLARQLTKRWDDLWSSDPDLELTEAGNLQLRRGDHIIDFANFSGGEKTMAVVLLRLITVQMTTRAGFICFDEPLEHLDVKNRRMLARLLVEASSAGPMRQVIVTTYEESIVRALGARSRDTERVRVEYVKAAAD